MYIFNTIFFQRPYFGGKIIETFRLEKGKNYTNEFCMTILTRKVIKNFLDITNSCVKFKSLRKRNNSFIFPAKRGPQNQIVLDVYSISPLLSKTMIFTSAPDIKLQT